jgi:hypothetical protein
MPEDDFEIKTFSLGKYTVEMFPEGYILLNKELASGYHPKLTEILNGYPVDEVDMRLSAISLYCGVVLDGSYTVEERARLCAILAGRLEVMREIPH